MKPVDYQEYKKFAVSLALHSGKILLDYRGKAAIVVDKGHVLDFATEADLASEHYIRNEIGKKFPDHGVMGEEGGITKQEADYLWIIDPLDGTLDYTRGFSSFDVHIALEFRKSLIAGCIYKPLTGELFSVSKDGGVKKDHHKVQVSSVSSMEKAILHVKLPRVTYSPEERLQAIRVLDSLSQKAGLIRAAWELGLALANVSAGSAEGVVLTKLGKFWWDVAPGILMVEEAGGKVTDMYGRPILNRDLSNGLVATNGILHDEVLHLIQSGVNQ